MKKVLIINDMVSDNYFTSGLTKLNCQVTSCKTKEALDLFLTENSDYILVVMEKSQKINPDVFAVYEVIKASFSDKQRLVVTGWLKNGDEDYIRLPTSPEEILQKFEA